MENEPREPNKQNELDRRGRFQEVRMLVTMQERGLDTKTKDELVEMVGMLARELLRYRDLACGPDAAAQFFNRKRSWIYEAMSRPNTELQHSLCEVAARESGGLLFRLSDLVRLRRRLFNRR